MKVLQKTILLNHHNRDCMLRGVHLNPDQDHSAIHLMPIEHLDGYFTYRRNTTNAFDKRGRPLPRKQTIKIEVATIHRMYKVIGVGKRYINRNQLPLIPKDQLRVSVKETQDVRQSMFDANEYVSLIRNAKDWYIKGISRFDPKTGEPIKLVLWQKMEED